MAPWQTAASSAIALPSRPSRSSRRFSGASVERTLAREDVGITPMGIPLLTGPGAIATMMVFLAGSNSMTYRVGVYVSAALVFVVSYLFLVAAARVDRVLGATGMMITIRLMGLVLAAVAVQFVADGIRGLVDLYQTSAPG